MQQLVSDVIDNGADSGCEFRKQAALILQNGDQEEIDFENIHIKLLRLQGESQHGFLLTDFPETLK